MELTPSFYGLQLLFYSVILLGHERHPFVGV